MIGIVQNNIQKCSKAVTTAAAAKVFLKVPAFGYKTLSAEDYLFNQRDANFANKTQQALLKPLAGCNHSEGSSDEINLIGAPLGQPKEEYKDYDVLQRSLTVNNPDLLFIQMDPSPFMARQRFMAHKCALKGVEDYEVNALEQIDPLKPQSWEECVVNLTVLDMLKRNQVHTEFQFIDTYNAYSYPNIQDKEITESLTQPFIQAINEHVVYKNYSPYHLVNRTLYTGLMGKQKVMLGDMPEPLLRSILGNTVEIQEMRDLFKFVLTKMKDLKEPISIRDASINFLPHIFNLPRDLYMTALLKDTFQAAQQITAVIGMHHLNPIQQYWEGPPVGINFTEATRIPDRIRGETDEVLIEKQAIMDVMLGTRVWGEKYIANPFPYIEQDITKISDQEYQAMKKCFFLYMKKYETFKNKLINELPHLQNVSPLLSQQTAIKALQTQESLAKRPLPQQ
ncbi:hypothetical protein ABPG74_002498 [Tetrahymena malaccensis]